LVVARLLIQNGVDVTVKNEYGATPMLHVCKHFKQNITNLMIENGADVNAQDNIGNTSLHMAGEHSDWSIYFGVSRMLLLNGANANVNNNKGETPLHLACREGCLEVVQLLLSLGANANGEDLQGLTLSAEDGRVRDWGAPLGAQRNSKKICRQCTSPGSISFTVESIHIR
jgi:ankyrin repeat protein